MKSPIPPGKKGQNLIEYALLLAIITSIGFTYMIRAARFRPFVPFLTRQTVF